MKNFGLLFTVLITLVFPVLPLTAQEIDEEELFSPPRLFPLAQILYAADHEAGEAQIWRPDWPLELPPDAFRFKPEEIRRVTIEGEGVSFSFQYGPEGAPRGRIEEFPFMLDNGIVQVRLVYRGALISELLVESGEASWALEILEYEDSFPSVVRATPGDAWYFISLSRGGNQIIETWYDDVGEALGAYGYSLVTIGSKTGIRSVWDYSSIQGLREYHYDSRGLITGDSGSGGLYGVLYYRDDLPRYWERRPREDHFPESGWAGNFYLQWDEQNVLLRIRGEDLQPEDGYVDYRYEYTLDERGNWIERRETRMISGGTGMGLLFPSAGTVFRRELEYRETE